MAQPQRAGLTAHVAEGLSGTLAYFTNGLTRHPGFGVTRLEGLVTPGEPCTGAALPLSAHCERDDFVGHQVHAMPQRNTTLRAQYDLLAPQCDLWLANN